MTSNSKREFISAIIFWKLDIIHVRLFGTLELCHGSTQTSLKASLITTWFRIFLVRRLKLWLGSRFLRFALLAIRLHLHFMLWLLNSKKILDLLHLRSILIFPFLGKSQTFGLKNLQKMGEVGLTIHTGARLNV